MEILIPLLLPTVIGSLFGGSGGGSGGYTPQQERLINAQAQMAELNAQIMADRYYNVEQPYRGAIMGNVMGFGNQLVGEGRNKITAPGIFEPQLADRPFTPYQAGPGGVPEGLLRPPGEEYPYPEGTIPFPSDPEQRMLPDLYQALGDFSTDDWRDILLSGNRQPVTNVPIEINTPGPTYPGSPIDYDIFRGIFDEKWDPFNERLKLLEDRFLDGAAGDIFQTGPNIGMGVTPPAGDIFQTGPDFGMGVTPPAGDILQTGPDPNLPPPWFTDWVEPIFGEGELVTRTDLDAITDRLDDFLGADLGGEITEVVGPRMKEVFDEALASWQPEAPAAPDLSGLATTESVLEALANWQPDIDIPEAATGFATPADLQEALANWQPEAPAAPDLSGLATTESVLEALANWQPDIDIPEVPTGFATSAELQNLISNIGTGFGNMKEAMTPPTDYATSADIQAALANWQPDIPAAPTDYLTAADLQEALASWQPEATAVPTTEALPAPIAGLPAFFGASEGDESWNPAYDLNGDGTINFDDLFKMADLVDTDTTPAPEPTVTAPTGSEQAYSIGQTYGLSPNQAATLSQMFDGDIFSNTQYKRQAVNMFKSWGISDFAAMELYNDMQSIVA